MESKGIRTILRLIVSALILSAILLLLVPRLLFEGDARWTYQNDTARVDVSFSGHLKNARVGVEGADLKVSQPAWLSNESYQGTVVELPVSYGTKSFQINLSPKADAWGEDATLIINFRGQDFRHRGKSRPAWVTFRNIVLNGQTVATGKVVCHDVPFVLKYSPHSSPKITLAFEVYKPFSASDLSFIRIIPVFLTPLLLSLFFAPLKRFANYVVALTNRKDIVRILSDGYRNIDPVYRRSFWIIFGVLCFAFGFYTICFMWGNHDWSYLDSRHKWLERAWVGRYGYGAIKILLSEGIYLPFIHDLIIFLTLAINAVLLCKYWHLEKRVVYYVLCGLILTAQPFTLSMMYFVNMTPEVFIGVTCALAALLLSEKIAVSEDSVTKKLLYSLSAVILINFSLAVYPVLINTIAVLFVGKLLVRSFDWDGSRNQIQSYAKPFVISSAHIVLGIVLYKLLITFVFPIRSFYNTDTLPMEQVPERLKVLCVQCFRQLYEYNYPFITQWILWVFLGFTILLTFYICFTGSIKQRLVRVFLMFGTLFATQTAMIIAKTHLVDGRVELFGLVFFEVLIMVLVITRFRQIHNLWIIAGTCVIFASAISDLDCLRVWKLGFDAEKMLWNRILARLEIQKDFDPSKKYEVVHVGLPISMRPRYYTRRRGKSMDRSFMLYQAYDFSHYPLSAPMFYYPTRFRGACFSTRRSRFYRDSRGYEARLKRLYQAGVLQKAEMWPKPNGLIVWKNIILFVTDGKELDNYREKFERELGKK